MSFLLAIQSATHSERSHDPLWGCIPSTFDPPVEKHCRRLCLTHRRVTIRSTHRSIEILHWFKKKKLSWYRIGSISADTQNFRYRIGSEKMVSLHPYRHHLLMNIQKKKYIYKYIYIHGIYIYIYIYIYIHTLPSKSLETPLAKCGFGRYHHKSLSFFGANTLK